MANYGCPSQVETWVRLHCLENGASSEVDVQKSSRPPASRVADPPVFEVARDYSSRGEGSAEMRDMQQIITGLPETTMDNEEQRKRSFAVGKPKLGELTRIIAIADPFIERR
jgi:hypothetical protein